MGITKINVSILSMVFQIIHQEINKLEKKGTEPSIQISEPPNQ
jgi:pentose-5-phosphate-3-epimerase